jgi:hypothetical protein
MTFLSSVGMGRQQDEHDPRSNFIPDSRPRPPKSEVACIVFHYTVYTNCFVPLPFSLVVPEKCCYSRLITEEDFLFLLSVQK